ncbi:MAG: hypothetical protein AB2L20_12280 [Mangrovibacterium sp.]
MNEGYVLEWLDDLVTIRLNPEITGVGTIQDDDIADLPRSIAIEKHKIKGRIKVFVFSVQNELQAKSGIKLYHSSLVALLDQATENHVNRSKNPEIDQVYDALIACINELIIFIENRFSFYLDAHERLPLTYFYRIKNELLSRIPQISNTLISHPEFSPGSDIFIQALLNYLDLKERQRSFTPRDTVYINELFNEIEQIGESPKDSIFTGLDERLIYMNFNYRVYVDHLVRRLADDIYANETMDGRMERLLLHRKSFRQLQRKPGISFNPKSQDIHSIVANWFRQEMSYLEKKLKISAKPNPAHAKLSEQSGIAHKSTPKITCSLSSDQIALLLRAAADLNILMAKSLNTIFRIIVPYLSTPHRTNLSFDGVRSKAYVGEQRDKDIIIGLLEKVIMKIKEY